MRITAIEAKKEKIRKLIDGCTDEKKLDDMLIVMEYIIKSSDEEKAWLRTMMKAKGFNARLFAQRLRESTEVSI